MFKYFYIIIILVCIFSCKEKNTVTASQKLPEVATNSIHKNQTPKDSIIYSVSKTCKDVKYKIELNFSSKSLVVKKNDDKYEISATKLIEEVSDKEMVSDFFINCNCLQNGLSVQYEFDLFLYKHKSKGHHIFFKEKDVFIKNAFHFFSGRNEEILFGNKFGESLLYSYDVIYDSESEFIELIRFQNFQDEDYEQNIDSYFSSIQKLYTNTEFDKLKLKANSIALELALKNVEIKEALVKYNDIAYYLEQSKAYEEAIFLLERIIKEFPDRTVSYINLGDAYWGLGEKEKAKKAYITYIDQMKASGKESKIPKTVLERV